MKKTLRMILQEYPMPGSSIARQFNKTREWLAWVADGKISYHVRQEHCLAIQEYLRQMGRELAEIEIVQPEDHAGKTPREPKRYRRTPETVAKYLKKPTKKDVQNSKKPG